MLKRIFKNSSTRIWSIVTIIMIVLMIIVTVLTSTVYYDLVCFTLGGERQVGRSDERFYDITATSKEDAYKRGNTLNEQVAEEGFVLLKNKDNALPLKGDEKKVSVFGKNSVNLVYGGSGSGGGKYDGAATIYDSLTAAGFECNPKLKSFYEDNAKSGEGRSANPAIENSGFAELYSGETPQANYTDDVKNSYNEYNDVALVVFSRIGGEGFDLPYKVKGEEGIHYLELDSNERALLDSVKKAGFKKVVVLINSSNIIEAGIIEDDPDIDACMFIGGPGYSGINALGRLLNGSVTPSGKTVDTWAADFTKNPTWNNFANNHVANSATYFEGEGEKEKATDYYYVEYEESIYVGYRYYETRGLTETEAGNNNWYDENVVYPFGYGLSYTTFKWEILNIENLSNIEINSTNKTKEIEITVRVTNTGDYKGKDVVELYCDLPFGNSYNGKVSQLQKSSTVLVDFEKTPMLYPADEAGADKPNYADITLKFNPYYAASYDYSDANSNGFKGYELEGGNYSLTLKQDSHTAKSGVDNIAFTVPDTGVVYDVDPVTGEAVVNRFEDADDQLDQLLTRTSWDATWPTAPEKGRNFSELSITKADLQDVSTNNPETQYEMPKTGEPLKYKLVELRGKDYDDPMWEEFLDTLQFEEMKDLYNKAAYSIVSLERIGLPKGIASDGPVGWTNFMSDAEVYGATSYASETVIASTWNEELAKDVGESIGEEAAYGNEKVDPYMPYTGWYAPGVNIHRSPFGGRNFEYFSEDPLLTGKMAAAEISGAKSKGLITFMKHFALNEQETHRDDNGVATWATEQAIREIYLKAFEIAVKEGQSNGLMTSFNRIGTKWTGGDYRLITEVLRNEWGFNGAVICDFNVGIYMNSKQMAYAGGDLNLTTTRPWTKASPDSAADVTMLRNAAHNSLYVLANSNIMNGINKDTKFTTLMPSWQQWLIIIDVVVVVALAAWGTIAIVSLNKKKKTESTEVEENK